jgi:hypothetical protein
MNIFTRTKALLVRIITAFKTPVAIAAKDAKAITFTVAVDTTTALASLETLSSRVKLLQGDFEKAIAAYSQFETKAVAWTELHIADAVKVVEAVPAEVAKLL